MRPLSETPNGASQSGTGRDSLLQCLHIADDMIRRQHEQAVIRPRRECGHCHGRCGIAANRFEHDCRAGDAQLTCSFRLAPPGSTAEHFIDIEADNPLPIVTGINAYVVRTGDETVLIDAGGAQVSAFRAVDPLAVSRETDLHGLVAGRTQHVLALARDVRPREADVLQQVLAQIGELTP